MANEEDLDLNPEENEAKGGGKGKLIIIIVAVLLLGGGGAAFFLMGGDDSSETVDETTSDSEGAAEEEVVTEGKGEAIYIGIPSGILAQLGSGKKTMTLQVQLDMRVRSKEGAEAIEKHMPLIENDLLMFFSSADVKEIQTPEGKKKLREGALKVIQDVLTAETGKPVVETVLFSGFVMQR